MSPSPTVALAIQDAAARRAKHQFVQSYLASFLMRSLQDVTEDMNRTIKRKMDEELFDYTSADTRTKKVVQQQQPGQADTFDACMCIEAQKIVLRCHHFQVPLVPACAPLVEGFLMEMASDWGCHPQIPRLGAARPQAPLLPCRVSI